MNNDIDDKLKKTLGTPRVPGSSRLTEKIMDGGPPPDGIPSIDRPKFVTVDQADEWIEENELVLAIEYEGSRRVYPLRIMVFHEIVNDTIGGDPVLITYCPLCGSGIAYVREIDGKAVEFGTSGKLYNSNLLMYDRLTRSLWTQIEGKAVWGKLTGARLVPLSLDTVGWGQWKGKHPDSEVLSRETGYSKPYGADPYGSYYTDRGIWFPLENRDFRLHPKAVVFGIEVNGVYKAYTEEDVRAAKVIDDEAGGVAVRVVIDDSGAVKVTNLETGEEIVKERDFWFAWSAFHPETELYERI